MGYKQLYLKSQIELYEERAKQNVVNLKSFANKRYETLLQIRDAQICSNRYVWKNLPTNLSSQQLEMLLYKYGSLVAYNENGKLKFSRYAKGGQLNEYGFLEEVTPIDFAGKTHTTKMSVLNATNKSIKNGCVILNDFTPLVGEGELLSRYAINKDTTIADEVETYKQLWLRVLSSTIKAFALCENEDQKAIIKKQVEKILYSDDIVVPIIKGNDKGHNNLLEWLKDDKEPIFEPYLQLIEFYDKERRAYNGTPTPNATEKRERLLVGETQMAEVHSNLVLFDGYAQRLNALENMKEYLKIDGLENTTVEINKLILDMYEDKNDNSEEIEEKEGDENDK